MGKINDKMRKSRAGMNDNHEGISPTGFGVSPVENITKTRIELEQDPNQHYHDWTFVKEIERRNEWGTLKATYSKYVCYCGGVKKTEQFEVEE